MIAFALMSLVFGGVILAQFGSSYWAIASETSNEGLYKAKTRLEELRAIVRKDFRLASSSPTMRISDSFCNSGSLCYFIKTDVTDLSPCSKYVAAQVDWRVSGYPTTTTSLFTNLTDVNEAISLGGDCPLTAPEGTWATALQQASADIGGGVPSGVDVLGTNAYLTSNQSPYLHIYSAGAFSAYANSFAAMDPLNNIDVARDVATGRTYGYAAIASTSVQLEVFDLTDTNNPTSVAKLVLNSVDKTGSFPQGWRAAYYDRKVYIATRETTGPEFHVVDVSNPANPVELGSRELNTSAYGIVVRDIKQNGTARRMVFLATSMNSKELMVLDASNPASITELAGVATDLPGDYDGRSVFLSGNTLYIGTVSNPGGKELYALDASNIFTASGGFSTVSSVEIGGGVTSIRVSEPFVFVANTKSGRELQVFTAVGGVLPASELSHFSVSGATVADMEGKYIYVASQNNPRLRLIKSQ